MVRDPVCGMEVDLKSSRYSMEYRGNTYYFCSEQCLNKFTSNPGKYLEASHESHQHRGMGGCMGCCGGGKMGYIHVILMALAIILFASKYLR
jgi:YHS domain-containing protein